MCKLESEIKTDLDRNLLIESLGPKPVLHGTYRRLDMTPKVVKAEFELMDALPVKNEPKSKTDDIRDNKSVKVDL